jgi:HK97 gp10 family phage protein
MSVTITGIADINRILGELAQNEARNLMRAVTYDIAKTAADTATKHTPDDPKTGAGDLKSSIKAKRDKSTRTRADASVRVTNIDRNFFWRFLEYGDGPDGVEHAMFAKAIEEMRPDMNRIYVEAFAKKLIARLVRERKRVG